MAAHAIAKQAHAEIRRLETTGELIASLELRYAVYGSLGYLPAGNHSRLELDSYDRYAIPFGAFDGGTLIGTLRLVTERIQPWSPMIDALLAAAADDELAAQANAPRPHPLPSEISSHITQRIIQFNTERFPVRELSRTIVRSDYRGAGVSRQLMELGLACASARGPAILIGGCLAEHVAMYARYGYTTLPETSFDRYDSVGQIARGVICRTDELPQPTRAHVDALLAGDQWTSRSS